MDDFNLSTIIESKNEWCARLTNTLTPCIIEGLRSIFTEAYDVCLENSEETKYLMTFQNFLNNIPKWSSEIVENEKQRIITSSACNYLEDLITCVHITQLKSLTSTRVGLKQKKINIDIPDLHKFIHKTYINVARKVYVNIYLFEKNIKPLQVQKNNRELELLIKECILNTIRESIPIEHILQMYLDETLETDVEVEEKKEVIVDKEALEKNKKAKEKKELEKIKQETAEKLREESKANLKNTILNANKDLNDVNVLEAHSTIKKLDSISTTINDTTSELGSESETETEPDTDNNYKLKIDKKVQSQFELDVQNLNEDPDKLDLDVLNLNTEISDTESIALDIEELK
uniref:Uncharacterized protein n=1 Tax=viral metagenome TaxID=1070528 RepID=A0A6C0D628_9ZZZZ